MKTQRSEISQKRRDGFALIVSLMLMVLLAILALGVLSLSAVTLRSSKQYEPRAIAEANARMALMIAIGQLQTEMGPDQRINATADLLTPELSGGRQRWVGTWDSWPASQTQRPEPKFRNWLISGSQYQGNISSPSSSMDLVPLAYSQDKTSILMSAPRVVIKNGGYAYAVSDENAKARLGSTVDPSQEDLAEHLRRFQSPPTGHGAVPGLEQLDRDDPRFNQLVSRRTVDLISTPAQALTQPDSYTVWSQGLLTNVRTGGFRKDLSLYFSDPATGSNALTLYNGTRMDNTVRGGINFRELRTFHEVSEKLTYNAQSFTHPDGGPLNSKVPVMAGVGNRHTDAQDEFFAYKRPMVIRVSWLISGYSRPHPTIANAFNIHAVVEPIVWLWNPFDVNLVMNPGGHLTVKCWGIPYNINGRVGTTNGARHFRNCIRNSHTNIQIGQNRQVVMRPGEVLIYSRGQQATAPIDISNSTSFEGRLGWSGNGGNYHSGQPIITVPASTPFTLSMSPTPGTPGSASGQTISFRHFVGGENTGTDYNCGVLEIPGNLNTSSFPTEMFKSVPTKQFSSAADLTTPQPLAIFSYMARTEREGMYKRRYLTQMSPVGMGFANNANDIASIKSVTFEPIMQALGGGLDRLADFDAGKGFFGASYYADAGQSYIATHSIPRERPISLGAFQHALANGVEIWKFSQNNQPLVPFTSWDNRILQPSTNHAIGNSFAHPNIGPNQTSGIFNNERGFDHSWLANQALWDDWFVSSLSDRNAQISGSPVTARGLFDGLAGQTGNSQPLPNRHYGYTGRDPAADADMLFDGSIPTSQAYQMVASMLRVDGAFNINSTDRAAWLAMFRSSQDLKVPVESALGAQSTWEQAENPIAALLVPKGSAAKSQDLGNPSTAAQWRGYRDPSDEELEELATAMVAEVRKRGPFLSLGDFVNRRLSTDPTLASSGALQAALDMSLNKTLNTGSRSGGSVSGVAFPEADQGSLMTQVPGHVKQGDILTSLGTRFTPRSDTFTIRAYGEALDAAGKVTASARCEAVVQRTPEYIDPTDDSADLAAELNSEANKRFGRKFSVVSFRWISKNEL